MTVLIGIYCTDGVVIGADSSAMFMHGFVPIMEQPTQAKISLIGGKLIVASSGAVGLGQRLAYHVEAAWNEKWFQADAHTVSTRLSAATLKAFSDSGVPQYGSQGGWRFAALLAAPIGGHHELFEYDSVTFQPERKTEDLRFVSAGSGQPLADPFLGFLRRVFWQNAAPNLQEGIFCALWTLRHTIELNPGGVGGDPQIAVLERDRKGQWGARVLSDDERGEHEEHCKSVEKHIAGYRQYILGEPKGDAGVPDVPQPR